MYLPDFIKSVEAPTVAGLILKLKAMNPTDTVAICEIVSISEVVKQVEKNFDVDGLDVVGLAEEVSADTARRRYDYLDGIERESEIEIDWNELLDNYIDQVVDSCDYNEEAEDE